MSKYQLTSLYLKDFRSTVALTFATSKLLYLSHCPCTHSYENYVTFKVVQFTSQITSTQQSWRWSSHGHEAFKCLINLKCQCRSHFCQFPRVFHWLYMDLRSYTYQHGLSSKTRTAFHGEILCKSHLQSPPSLPKK